MLEALGSTKLNLLYDVGFNREVAQDSALYWTKEDGNLSQLIDNAEKLNIDEINKLSKKSKQRITQEYSWDCICDRYLKTFCRS